MTTREYSKADPLTLYHLVPADIRQLFNQDKV